MGDSGEVSFGRLGDDQDIYIASFAIVNVAVNLEYKLFLNYLVVTHQWMKRGIANIATSLAH